MRRERPIWGEYGSEGRGLRRMEVKDRTRERERKGSIRDGKSAKKK